MVNRCQRHSPISEILLIYMTLRYVPSSWLCFLLLLLPLEMQIALESILLTDDLVLDLTLKRNSHVGRFHLRLKN